MYAHSFKPCSCINIDYTGEHRYPGIANMNAFHNAVGGAPLTNVLAGTSQQVGAFCCAVCLPFIS
jgi:hypothetical protein